MKRLNLINRVLKPVTFVSVSVVVAGCNSEIHDPGFQKPNVIIINTDDQGYGDLSCQGSPTIRTPNIDQLASEGARLTSFYAAGNVCIPSRKGLMTGRYSARIASDGHVKNKAMSNKEITLAELFKNNNYATAILGKWHLGMVQGSHPNDQGFDYFYGTSSSNDHFRNPLFPIEGFKNLRNKHFNLPLYKWNKNARNEHFNLPLYKQNDTIEIPAKQELFTQRYTTEAVNWIKDNKNNPFFLYIAYNMPHVPIFASENFIGKSYGGLYGDVIEEIDWSVGQIRKALEENGLDNNTIIIYTSDNGPWRIFWELGGSQGPFNNGKGTPWEGAYRVPGIFWWPDKINPSVIMEPASQLDLFATFSALLDEPLPSDRIYDSKNLLPMLLEGQISPRETFFYFSEVNNELWAVRKGNYKILIKTVNEHRGTQVTHDPPLLFNLAHDHAETHNIAEEHPEIVKELMNIFDDMNRQLQTSFPRSFIN